VQDRRVGALVAFYERPGRLRLEETRVVGEVAALVSAMVELSEMEAQGERLARAELSALRAQISPHFIYNALAAVASFIHSRPEEARELLTEFAEFIRYAFARQRAYVTVADELRYVEKYLRLEQARFGERLKVRVQVDPEVLQAVLPVLSLQPLVENAVRHGVEREVDGGLVAIEGIDLGNDVALRVSDDGAGIDPERARDALAGRGPGIGLGNVHGRLLSTFGEGYGLEIDGTVDRGTTVIMTLPKFRAGVRAA
jgi:two-component system, LytTR family, sensor kinase